MKLTPDYHIKVGLGFKTDLRGGIFMAGLTLMNHISNDTYHVIVSKALQMSVVTYSKISHQLYLHESIHRTTQG